MKLAVARASTARGERSPRLPMGVATTTRRAPRLDVEGAPDGGEAGSDVEEAGSDVEADLEDIAIDDLVLLAFDPQFADVPGRRPRPEG